MSFAFTGQKSGGKTSQPQVSRKEARKLDRLERKKRKADFFSGPQKALKRCADDEHAESPKRKKARVVDVPKASVPEGKPTGMLKPPLSDPDKSKPKRPQKVVPRKHDPTPSLCLDILGTQGRTQKEQDEDGYIAYLESKLGYNKSDKMTRRALADDGLDGELATIEFYVIRSTELRCRPVRSCFFYHTLSASMCTPMQISSFLIQTLFQARESEHNRDGSSSDDSSIDNEPEESHDIQSSAADDSILPTSGTNISKSKDMSATGEYSRTVYITIPR
jgi:hypothetical protein